ncbi:MAG: Hpt domain-containing protein [Burkholderiales bacterium]
MLDDDTEQLNAAFLAAHATKDGASSLSFDDVVRLTRAAETLLDVLGEGRRRLDGDCMDALPQSRAPMDHLLAEIDHGETAPERQSR